jgi:hypothetical protein
LILIKSSTTQFFEQKNIDDSVYFVYYTFQTSHALLMSHLKMKRAGLRNFFLTFKKSGLEIGCGPEAFKIKNPLIFESDNRCHFLTRKTKALTRIVIDFVYPRKMLFIRTQFFSKMFVMEVIIFGFLVTNVMVKAQLFWSTNKVFGRLKFRFW